MHNSNDDEEDKHDNPFHESKVREVTVQQRKEEEQSNLHVVSVASKSNQSCSSGYNNNDNTHANDNTTPMGKHIGKI